MVVRTNGTTIKEGQLTKKGAFVKNWKLRYWILQSDRLMYFQSVLATEATGIILLKDASIRESSLDQNQYPFCFELVTPLRTYFIRGQSQEEKISWWDALNSQIYHTKAVCPPLHLLLCYSLTFPPFRYKCR